MVDTNNIDYSSTNKSSENRIPAVPLLATVVGHQDPTYMGQLEVLIDRPVGGNYAEGQLQHVSYSSPFYGVTSEEHIDNNNDYNGTQKSYGMWMIPPDPGTRVIVIFINGDTKNGYFIGCVPDKNMNFMVPGLAAQQNIVDSTDSSRLPTAEYNKKVNETPTDPEQIAKPLHPFAEVLTNQGLDKDDTRGITTSSARRDTPSMVFGISTPGPLDKQQDAKRGRVGKTESQVANYHVSRLGGTTFVLDDGDDHFIRMGSATDSPPEYEALEQLPDGTQPSGDVTIPHNELVRIRTRTGHQILLHNSEDLIYIGNARGTAWIELTSNGKIDIYAEDSISVHTKNDMNFYADRDINFEAKRNVNVKAGGNQQFESGGNRIIIASGDNTIKVGGKYDNTIGGNTSVTTGGKLNVNTGGDNNFTAGGNTNLFSGGNHVETASKIDMNGPTAAQATKAAAPSALGTFLNATDANGGGVTSIMKRVPNVEPWPHHENLNPTDFTPDKTDNTAKGNILVSKYFQVYSTTTDTFLKVGPTTTDTTA
jgi:hypothetical protein